jgi:signal transduction histidine kinase
MDQIKEHFYTITSHELRTPLTIIKGYLDVFPKFHIDDELLIQGLNAINRNVDRMYRLVLNINDFIAVEKGIFTLKIEQGNLNDTIDTCIDDYSPLLKKKGITLRFNKPEPAIIGYFDFEKMTQVVGNILDNAIKFVPNGTITISLTQEKSNILLRVKDSGLGINPDQLDRLFKPFKQPNHVGKSGLGLGLFVCREIVHGHGGTISIESEGTGKGTSVSIRIPISDN